MLAGGDFAFIWLFRLDWVRLWQNRFCPAIRVKQIVRRQIKFDAASSSAIVSRYPPPLRHSPIVFCASD